LKNKEHLTGKDTLFPKQTPAFLRLGSTAARNRPVTKALVTGITL
jgi:hypothetical protein